MIYILQKVYSYTIMRFLFWFIKLFVVYFEKKTIKHASKILTCSSVHADLLKKKYNVISNNVYPGCYPVSKIKTKKDNYILAFTRWDHDKHPDFLLDLLERLSSVNLVIAGKWTNLDDFAAFKKQIKEMGLTKRVIIHDFLSKEKLIELSKKALVWIHPNFEAFGMGGLEAAACGCPIIIPNGSGVTELFKTKVHGFFSEGLDLESIVKFIEPLLENRAKFAEMGEKAWKVACRYTWEYHAKMIEKYIKASFNN
jgi:glycosyltransferase involved in cell wall biosynthesis